MKLWIANLADGTSDEELRELIGKYTPELECTAIHRVRGDGSRQAATLEFRTAPPSALEKVSSRLHGMHWKGQELFVRTLVR